MSESNEQEIILQSIMSDMQMMAQRIMFLETTLGKLIEGLATVGILQVEESDEAEDEEQAKKGDGLIICP